MPNVNGMKFPYTPEGKAAAKKAAIGKKRVAISKTKSAGKKTPKKQNFSGVASQIYS